MTGRIPDLWRLKEDADQLYQLYLAHLQSNRRHQRVVSACRRIRRYAVRGPGPKQGLFTFSFEIDCLCDLKKYAVAWRQLRHRDELIFGDQFDPAHREWSPNDFHQLVWYYAPLLFFLGKYRLGCALLETALSFWFQRRSVRSYDLLFHVYNGEEEPSHRCCVTLKHFYERLGRDLREWSHWRAFVNGFHPRLFRLSQVRREDLLADSARIAVFSENLMILRAERITSGVDGGQSDLVDSEAKVKKRQEATQEKLDQFHERFQPIQERTNAKLCELFPELRELFQ